MSAQTYFDFHLHPVFKQLFSQYEEQYPSIRNPLDLLGDLHFPAELLRWADDIALHFLGSQCSLSQMLQGRTCLGVANVIAMELGIADSQSLAASLLRSRLTRPIDKRYFEVVRNGSVSYYQLCLKELDLYRQLHQKGHIRVLSRKTGAGSLDQGINLALAIEGGHNLNRMRIGQSSVPDQATRLDGQPLGSQTGIPSPAESLQLLFEDLWAQDMDLFSLTLTHLSHIDELPLATHAYGMKLLRHPAFYPVGNGLREAGRQLIDAAYTMQAPGTTKKNKKATPILLDIKHMSLQCRQDFYEYRRQKGYTVPIIASHMGVTGYSLQEWKDALDADACSLGASGYGKLVRIVTRQRLAGVYEPHLIDKRFYFNPWSINMMDEDIVEVLASGGLIGLSLDVRILGYEPMLRNPNKQSPEYFSAEEFRLHFPQVPVAGLQPATPEVVAEEGLLPSKKESHPLALSFNILHIIAVGKRHLPDSDPWLQVAIGSDFDGLIEPVKVCRSSEDMDELEQALLTYLPIAEGAYREAAADTGHETGPLLPRNGDALDQAGLKACVRALLYDNGRRFIERWLQGNF